MVDVENTRHNIFKFNAMVLCNLGKDGASEKNQCSRCFHNVFLKWELQWTHNFLEYTGDNWEMSRCKKHIVKK